MCCFLIVLFAQRIPTSNCFAIAINLCGGRKTSPELRYNADIVDFENVSEQGGQRTSQSRDFYDKGHRLSRRNSLASGKNICF